MIMCRSDSIAVMASAADSGLDIVSQTTLLVINRAMAKRQLLIYAYVALISVIIR